jgi:AraC-like DNA-binding protein
MEYKEYQPHHLLSAYIECYWSALADRPPFREQESLIPDGTIELMFNFGDDYAQIVDEKKVQVKGSHIIGIRKQSLLISQTHKQNIFSVRFKPGGSYPFFRIPAYLFSNTFITIDDLLTTDYTILEDQLANAKSNEARVQLMNLFLLAKLDTLPDAFLFVAKCSKALLQNPAIKINDLACQFNTNYKMMERRFNTVLGLTPSELLKIKRFNDAVLAMYSCRHHSLTDIAYECGYYDQSHFIREFKQLSHFTPREFLQEQFTIVQVIQPALAERLSKLYNL